MKIVFLQQVCLSVFWVCSFSTVELSVTTTEANRLFISSNQNEIDQPKTIQLRGLTCALDFDFDLLWLLCKIWLKFLIHQMT